MPTPPPTTPPQTAPASQFPLPIHATHPTPPRNSITVSVWNAIGLYCNKYRLNNGNNANHCTLNNKYEKTVVVEGNREANTTEPKIAKFNDNDVGNLSHLIYVHKKRLKGIYFIFFHDAEE